jgi:predicted dehydrogenase
MTSPNKVRWGVLGAAAIAQRRVIPAMLKCEHATIVAIASRERHRAEEATQAFGIPKAYGSYDELLADPGIEVIYNPLPNDLHVDWSIRAANAGKHVLCEKPVSVDAAGVRRLIQARDRTGVKIGEGFMVRTHPRWLRTRELIRSGRVGELRVITGLFGFFNNNANDIRNMPQRGGGSLLDIGCYPITLSRFILGEEPTRVFATTKRDPQLKTDILTSAILEFPSARSTFTCGTQMTRAQEMKFIGTQGRIEIERAINPSTDKLTEILFDAGQDPFGTATPIETIPACNQFTIQGDLFSCAVRGEGEVPVPLEDSVKNMAVIDAIFRSTESGRWEKP